MGNARTRDRRPPRPIPFPRHPLRHPHLPHAFPFVPFWFTCEAGQPTAIASVLLRTLRVRQIRLFAGEYHREIVLVRVRIHAIAIAGYEPRYLPNFKRRGLSLDELPELAFHPWFDAKTSDGSVHVRLLSLM